jgi:predicted O-methyltransferase YrrM
VGYSNYAIKQAFKHPQFSVGVLISWLRLRDDVQYVKRMLNRQMPNATNHERGASGGLKEVALYNLIRKFRPERMIETGVCQGVSTYFVLRAMEDNNHGTLVSIDLPNYDKRFTPWIPQGMQPGWIVPERLRNRWQLKIGKSLEVLSALPMTIDAFYHDSDHSYENMKKEFAWAVKHLKQAGAIIADDAWRNNAWTELIETTGARVLSSPFPALVLS